MTDDFTVASDLIPPRNITMPSNGWRILWMTCAGNSAAKCCYGGTTLYYVTQKLKPLVVLILSLTLSRITPLLYYSINPVRFSQSKFENQNSKIKIVPCPTAWP